MSIEAMKQALEALEKLFGIPEQFTGKGAGDVAVWTLGGSYRAQQAIPVLRQAIAEEEKQEPVACHTCKGLGRIYMGCGSWIHCDTCNTTGKATTPPKREWVGLQPLQVDKDGWYWLSENECIHVDLIRKVEAAHGIKEEA